MRLKAIFLFLLLVLSPVPAFADSITIPNTFSAGTSAQASQVNANFAAVSTVVNGNLDNANIKAAAGIVPSKLSLISEYLNLQATNNRGFSTGVTGDTVPRVAQNSRGSIDFGPGSSTAMDVSIVRVDSNTLGVRDQANAADKNFTVGALTFSDTSAGTALLQVLRSTNNNCVAVGVTGDTNPRLALNSRGSVDLGSGSGSLDLAITREDANTVAVRDQGNSTYKNLKVGVLTPATAISAINGGTGQIAYTVGDILVCQTTDTLSKLPIGPNGTFVGVSGGTVGYYAPSGGLFKASSISSTARTLPTSGALSGTYINNGNITSTGTYTFSHDTRIYLKGDLVIGHTMTGTAQSNGGTHATSVNGGSLGGGLGPGTGGCYQYGGGGGGACAGAGGRGGYTSTNAVFAGGFGGKPYTTWGAGGSGGGTGAGDGSSGVGQSGGGGGPFLLIEVDGNVTLNETISANGAAGSNATSTAGAGGGGGGGQICIRCTGTLTLASAKKVQANGGAGGNHTGSGLKAGGGGGGRVETWSGGSTTLTGSLESALGAKGTGTAATFDAADGSAGVTESIQNTMPISLFMLNVAPLRPIDNVIKFERKERKKCG